MNGCLLGWVKYFSGSFQELFSLEYLELRCSLNLLEVDQSKTPSCEFREGQNSR